MTRLRLIFLGAVAAAAALTGCGNPDRSFSMQRLLEKVKGDDDQQLVRQMFGSPDPDLRREAIERLSRKKHYRKGTFLKGYATLCRDPAPTVRSAAVRALGRARDPKYAKPLVNALSDEDTMVRWDAAAALDSVVALEAIGPLARAAMNDPSTDVRSSAARALRHYRRADVVETLLSCLDDPEFAVRFRARESLTELTGKNSGPDPKRWRQILSWNPKLLTPPKAPRP